MAERSIKRNKAVVSDSSNQIRAWPMKRKAERSLNGTDGTVPAFCFFGFILWYQSLGVGQRLSLAVAVRPKSNGRKTGTKNLLKKRKRKAERIRSGSVSDLVPQGAQQDEIHSAWRLQPFII